jgi:hypothetical protein
MSCEAQGGPEIGFASVTMLRVSQGASFRLLLVIYNGWGET